MGAKYLDSIQPPLGMYGELIVSAGKAWYIIGGKQYNVKDVPVEVMTAYAKRKAYEHKTEQSLLIAPTAKEAAQAVNEAVETLGTKAYWQDKDEAAAAYAYGAGVYGSKRVLSEEPAPETQSNYREDGLYPPGTRVNFLKRWFHKGA